MQRESVSDLELNLKKRARRRLVGAIALVLLMIIVLPMILKDRAAITPAEKIIITLPNEQSQPAPSDFDSSIVPAEPAEATIDATKSETPPEKETNIATSADTEATAPAKDTTAKETAGNKFYVQVGVFSDAGNVKQLQAKLTDLGYKSQTEKISTDKGKKIRLRTQVFDDRNEAAIALENIKDAGLTGMVVSQ